ncbi:MAG: hypothetical protein ACI80V_003118 [Rhodothermales bacterium]|jgi:hypothetical protein
MRKITSALVLTVFLVSTGATMAAPDGYGVAECRVVSDPPPYYSIDLVTTKRVPGARMAKGKADVVFASSPFGVSLSSDGSYVYDLLISVDKMAPAKNGAYVVWVTTPSLDERVRLGVLDDNFELTGRVAWNKFLVVVSLEPDAAEEAPSWTGPIVVRGMSRSGKMHTLAGHGPFEVEPCAVYGY